MRTKTLYLSILILLMNLNYSIAQKNDSCSCCTKDHEAFDFWLGDWTVYNREGQTVGTNKIVRIQNGCVLQENWIATNKTNTGTSYNFYELSDDTWNQVWISNTGKVLRLKGNINASGAMVLKSDLIESSNGNYFNQITWTKNDDGTVTQLWVILNEENKIIRTDFEGIYHKTNEQSIIDHKNNHMKLGAPSVSLSVKNLDESKLFYEKLGFTVLAGSMEQNYLIMKNENSLIGLFQGMFEGNILTFNPGWDVNGQNIEPFDDVRKIQKHLKSEGIKLDAEANINSSGPASIMLKDPDGNLILIDQHR